MNTIECTLCYKTFTKENKRVLDHLHKLIENNFRYVCCRKCNMELGAVERIKDNVNIELLNTFLQ